MKIATIIGTRPEIIRLSRVIPLLDECCDHTLIHTGQNYDPTLKDVFFTDLKLRQPDIQLECQASTLAGQLSQIFTQIEETLTEIKPDKVLILGDTNTSLSAVIAERLKFPVYHMEAGNRCFDMKVPEEKNRKVIDAISSYNMPYTPGSRENLIREGISKHHIFESGNPIAEVLKYYSKQIDNSTIIRKLKLGVAGVGGYVLVTAHREENVDNQTRLVSIVEALLKLSHKYKVVFSCHPRTKKRLSEFKLDEELKSKSIIIHEPFGFFDFVKLEKEAVCVVTDSGTVQEECCILQTPTVTIRDSTERPETVECGSNIVSGIDPQCITNCTDVMIAEKSKWNLPIGYGDVNVSSRVVNYLMGNQI